MLRALPPTRYGLTQVMSDRVRVWPSSSSSATPSATATAALAFVRESSYVSEREVLRYGAADAVADVGGFLGLLLGVSALDVVRAATRGTRS